MVVVKLVNGTDYVIPDKNMEDFMSMPITKQGLVWIDDKTVFNISYVLYLKEMR